MIVAILVGVYFKDKFHAGTCLLHTRVIHDTAPTCACAVRSSYHRLCSLTYLPNSALDSPTPVIPPVPCPIVPASLTLKKRSSRGFCRRLNIARQYSLTVIPQLHVYGFRGCHRNPARCLSSCIQHLQHLPRELRLATVAAPTTWPFCRVLILLCVVRAE